jgi:hypothetical protein
MSEEPTSFSCLNVCLRYYTCLNFKNLKAALGGLVVTCWPPDPKFVDSYLPEGDRFLRAIKIDSMTSFGGEVKPSVPCRKFTAY